MLARFYIYLSTKLPLLSESQIILSISPGGQTLKLRQNDKNDRAWIFPLIARKCPAEDQHAATCGLITD
jgi:hypothetical protein